MNGRSPPPIDGGATFWQAFKASYGGGLAFLVACPLLALVPVAFEVIQHVVEVRIGMYASLAMAKAVEHDPWRMGFGFVKVAALIVPGYWIVRFLASRDAGFAVRADRSAVRLFVVFFTFEMALAAVQLFVLPPTGTVLLASFLVGQVIGCLLAAWGVAAALGNAAIGPRASAAIMARQLPWTFPFLFVVMLPLMIPHSIMGALAILGPRWSLWPVLIADSLLVGWLTTVIVASSFQAATRAAALAGVTLSPA